MTKKILTFSIVSLLIITFIFSAVAEARTWGRPRKCDVNMDGRITRNDADLIIQHAIGLISLSGVQKWAADADNDGRILAYDAALAARTAEGLGYPNCSSYLKKSKVRLAR